MDFEIPAEIRRKLAELDAFIEREITPLEREHPQFFDHRREHARTDWENGGRPRREWEELLGEMRRRADAAGHLRYALPKRARRAGRLEPRDGDHPRAPGRARGSACTTICRTSRRSSATSPPCIMMLRFGTPAQKAEFLPGMITGTHRVGFGLTEPDHGSDATWLETTARRDGGDWVINGTQALQLRPAQRQLGHDLRAHRRQAGRRRGHHLLPRADRHARASRVDFMWWTFNMPSDHAEVTLRGRARARRAPSSARSAAGSRWRSTFVHENRIRQAASGVGAAQYCIDESVAYAKRAHRLRQAALAQPGDPVPARRAADRVRDGAQPRLQDRVARSTAATTWT